MSITLTVSMVTTDGPAISIAVVMNEGKVEQIDNPLTVYNKPKSAFVSEFVGGHNIIQEGNKLL